MTNIETTTGGIPAISSIEISPELRRSTELFHEAIRNHSQHNKAAYRRRIHQIVRDHEDNK